MAHDMIPFELGKVHFINCMDGLRKLPDNSINAIHSDCPRSSHNFIGPSVRVLSESGVFIARSGLAKVGYDVKLKEAMEIAGLKIVHIVKTVDFNFTRPFDCQLIGIKNGHEIQTENIPKESIHERVPLDERICEAQRDVETFEDLLRWFTKPGDVVLELCAGSAALGVACLRSGREYLGFDNGERIVKKANERLAGFRTT